MIRHFVFTLSCMLLSTLSYGQTKLIAHKSHSGSRALFRHVLANHLFGVDNSNFGMAPEPSVTLSNLDSVIFVSDTVAVMVTSLTCDVSRRFKKGIRWTPGRDTVLKHPLFSMQHGLDSIRKSLKRDYFFDNSIDSVKFIGYDNRQVLPEKKARQNKKEYLPVDGSPKGEGPGRHDMIPFFALIVVLSAVAGFFSWKFVKA
jgi:hypothetical protein